jgi:hypothetical protein
MVVAGIVTYLVVLNLDPLLRLGHHVAEAPRKYLLNKMDPTHAQPDENQSEEKSSSTKSAEKWSSRAKRFEPFPRPEEGPKPSDWLLFLFAVRVFAIGLYHAPRKIWVSLSRRPTQTETEVEVRV